MSDQDTLGVYSRRIGESQKAFAAYVEYRDMGVDRSLVGVGQRLGKSSSFLSRWSARWGWVARARAYDDDLAAKEKAAKDFALKAEAEKWAKRRLEIAEQEWQELDRFGKKLDQMDAFPLQTVERKTTEESKDGKTVVNNTTVIKAVGWGIREVINGRALVLRWRRVVLGLATGNTTTTVQGTGEGGGIVVEDIEEVRKRRWEAAMPGLMRLMRKELGTVGDVQANPSGEAQGE